MATDGRDPGPVWQEPVRSSQGQVSKQVQPAGGYEEAPQGALSSPVYSPADVALPAVLQSSRQDEEDLHDLEGTASSAGERLKRFPWSFTYILIPLLFGAVTAIFVLPLLATGNFFLPREGLWIVSAIIVAVMIAQGIAIYVAGDNNGLWALATAGGFSLFLLIGCFAIFGPLASLILLLVLIVVSVVIIRFCFCPVPEGYVDVVYAAGKYSRTLSPGFNLLLPWEKVSKRLKTGETQWLCPRQRVQLSPTEDILLRAVISYQLPSAYAHLVATQITTNWEEDLREYFIACLQTIATTFTPDDFIAWPQGLHTPVMTIEHTSSLARRQHINEYLCTCMRNRFASLHIVIREVIIRDVMIAPHDATVLDAGMPISFAPAESLEADVPTGQLVADDTAAKGTTGATASAPTPKAVEPAGVAFVADQEPAVRRAPKILSEDILRKAYKEVQDGKITDPQTIRGIAAHFQDIANDAQASQQVNFDAAQAALNLYNQARKYEEHYRTYNSNASGQPAYSDIPLTEGGPESGMPPGGSTGVSPVF
ncbi:MAG: hypothetical protein IMW89_05830 [Ktedonobacteraceae bacterium]|nr:hypothetical protein [Ktedonobacteraceae bacterium]